MVNKNNINAVNMGFAAGIISAGCMLFLSLGRQIGLYLQAAMAMENFHMFYSSSFFGTISGMIEAGIIGFLIGYLLIRVYNLLQNRN